MNSQPQDQELHAPPAEPTGCPCLYLFFFKDFIIYFIITKFFNVYYFGERVHMHTSGGGAERPGDTESKAGSRLRAVSTEPDMGLELRTVRS